MCKFWLCAHFFIFCTCFAPMTMIIGASRKNSSQILSFHTLPRSDVFWKIWEAPPWLPDFCELEGVVTPNSGSSSARSIFFVHSIARKNYQIYQVPTHWKFKYCTVRISSKYKTVFSITLGLQEFLKNHNHFQMSKCRYSQTEGLSHGHLRWIAIFSRLRHGRNVKITEIAPITLFSMLFSHD